MGCTTPCYVATAMKWLEWFHKLTFRYWHLEDSVVVIEAPNALQPVLAPQSPSESVGNAKENPSHPLMHQCHCTPATCTLDQHPTYFKKIITWFNLRQLYHRNWQQQQTLYRNWNHHHPKWVTTLAMVQHPIVFG